MLKSIRIKNFQSIYDAELPLQPFTVLVGASSSGKSAIVRALHLLVNNKRGSDFISHSTSTATVSAELNGHSVEIHRSTSSSKPNQYMIDGVKFTKLGGESPQEARSLFPPSELAIVRQFDQPFLLTSPGAEVARTLGSLTNVDKVFAAAREAGRRKLGASADVRATKDSLTSATEALEELEDTEALERAVEAVTEALRAYESLSSRHAAASAAVEGIHKLTESYRSVVFPTPLGFTAEDISGVREKIAAAESSRELLTSIRQAVTGLKKISTLPKLKFSQADIDEARGSAMQAVQARELVTKIRETASAYKSSAAAVKEAAGKRDALVQQRQEVLDSSDVCAMCGQTLP